MRLKCKLYDDGAFIEDVETELIEFLERGEEIADRHITDAFERNFAEEGRPMRWRSLHKRTIQERHRLGYGPGPILVRSGSLKQSWIDGVHRSDIDRHRMIATIEVGSADIRAGTHEFGMSTAVGTYVPSRPVMIMTDEDIEALERELNEVSSDIYV